MRKLHTAPQMSLGMIRVSRSRLVAPFLLMFLNNESAIEIIRTYFFFRWIKDLNFFFKVNYKNTEETKGEDCKIFE